MGAFFGGLGGKRSAIKPPIVSRKAHPQSMSYRRAAPFPFTCRLSRAGFVSTARNLTFSLEPQATASWPRMIVRWLSGQRPMTAGRRKSETAAPCADGTQTLAPGAYLLDEKGLTMPNPPAQKEVGGDRKPDRPGRQHEMEGPVSLQRHVLKPVRAAKAFARTHLFYGPPPTIFHLHRLICE